MDLERYHLYVVEGEEALEAVNAYEAGRQDAHRQRMEWARSVGGVGYTTRKSMTETRVSGIHIRSGTDFPKHWRESGVKFDDGGIELVPSRRSKEGRDLAKHISTMKVYGGHEIAAVLGFNAESVDDGAFRISSVGKVFDHWIVFSPINAEPPPQRPGCRPIKLSEFYAMKESASEAVPHV